MASLPGASTPPLTDRLLRSWLRCRRRAWLDRHGAGDRRQWSAHRALALQEQVRSFRALVPQRPARGEQGCAAAAAAVVGLRLRGQVGSLAVEAQPSLLQRVEGTASRWGPHAYRPVLARQGRRVTREHRLVLALWARLLALHQQAPVDHGLVLAGAGRQLERERLSLGMGLQRQLEQALQGLAADLARPDPPPLVNDRKKCTLCSWRGLCDAEAEAEGHLSEVSGIGGKRREMLLEQGITSLGQLAQVDPDQLGEALAVHGEQHREVAAQLVAQAMVQVAGEPRRLRAGPALPELHTAPGVLLYDIESDPDARDDFLHGLLRLPLGAAGGWPEPATAGPSGRYHPLLALQEHGEARLWRRLRTRLGHDPTWPLLHYGETEAIALLRLAERQGADARERQQLKARLVDVHQRLRQHWLLPVNSYGLKAVAGWLQFRWSQKGVDGARCLLWWRQWRAWQGGDRPVRLQAQDLDRIFTYNRDDALATWAVAHWLLQQDQAGVKVPQG